LPVNDVLTVEFTTSQTSNVEIEIFDVIGRKVYTNTQVPQTGLNRFDLDLSDLPAGQLFIQLIQDNEMISTQLVKL